MLRRLSSITLSSNGDNIDGNRDVRDVLDICFQSLKKRSNDFHQQQQYNDNSLDILVKYLQSEWLCTFADLQLGKNISQCLYQTLRLLFLIVSAYHDDVVWKNLKIPSRLKLELKEYILSSYYEQPDRTATVFQIASDDTEEIVYYQIENQNFSTDEEQTLSLSKSLSPSSSSISSSSLSTKTEAISAENKTVWMKCYSHVHNHSYYYNSITHETLWECPDEVLRIILYQ